MLKYHVTVLTLITQNIIGIQWVKLRRVSQDLILILDSTRLQYYKRYTAGKNYSLQVLDDQLATMQSNVNKEMRRSGTAKELFTGKQYRRAIFIAMGKEDICIVHKHIFI